MMKGIRDGAKMKINTEILCINNVDMVFEIHWVEGIETPFIFIESRMHTWYAFIENWGNWDENHCLRVLCWIYYVMMIYVFQNVNFIMVFKNKFSAVRISKISITVFFIPNTFVRYISNNEAFFWIFEQTWSRCYFCYCKKF